MCPYAPLQCMQRQNEIIQVPDGWYHAVTNIGDTLAVASETNNHPENSFTFVKNAYNSAYKNGDYETSRHLIDKAFKQVPKDPQLFAAKAAVFFKTGQSKKAL